MQKKMLWFLEARSQFFANIQRIHNHSVNLMSSSPRITRLPLHFPGGKNFPIFFWCKYLALKTPETTETFHTSSTYVTSNRPQKKRNTTTVNKIAGKVFTPTFADKTTSDPSPTFRILPDHLGIPDSSRFFQRFSTGKSSNHCHFSSSTRTCATFKPRSRRRSIGNCGTFRVARRRIDSVSELVRKQARGHVRQSVAHKHIIHM